MRKLSLGMLPSSACGGPGMTKAMIHVTWHVTTIAFLTVGFALLLSGSVLRGVGSSPKKVVRYLLEQARCSERRRCQP